MFGFKEQSTYAFNPADEIAGNASGNFANGDTFEFRRRKGRKNVVSGTVGSPARSFDDVELTRFLGQANASLYANVFAFGLGELERGDELLKHKNLQSALYAGALGGGRNVQAIARSSTRKSISSLIRTRAARIVRSQKLQRA